MRRAALLSGKRFNLATGGTESTYTVSGQRWRLHKFTAGGNLIVLRSVAPTFRVAYVGNGGGGGASDGTYGGGGGDGGFGADLSALTIGLGTYAIVIPATGTGGGGSVTGLGYTGTGGNGGVDGSGSNQADGTSHGMTSNIEDGVTSKQYGIGGNNGVNLSPTYPSTPVEGHGGGGQFGGSGSLPRTSGNAGAFWIAYPIA